MASTSNPPLPTRTRQTARTLRQTQTDAEAKLWYRLRAGRLLGYKFRRQHPVPPYVVDFVCVESKLVVELDGSQHNVESDRARTAFLEAQGFRVLRFWDNAVLNETDAVLEAIVCALGDRTLTPSPSPGGRGGQAQELEQEQETTR